MKLVTYNSDNGLFLAIFPIGTPKSVIIGYMKKKLIRFYKSRGHDEDDASEEIGRMKRKIEMTTLKPGKFLHKEYETLFLGND